MQGRLRKSQMPGCLSNDPMFTHGDMGLIFTPSSPPSKLKQRPVNVVLQNAKMDLGTCSRGLTSAKK